MSAYANSLSNEPEPFFTEEDIIYTYTREDALDDGVLIDVSETAHEAGFRWPVAVTAGVWDVIENIPPSKSYQDIEGRLWDVLYMAWWAIRDGHGRDDNERLYQLICHHGRKTYLTLKMVTGPHGPSNPAPCVTIMLPGED